MTRGPLGEALDRLVDEQQSEFADATADAGLAPRIRDRRRRVVASGALASVVLVGLVGLGVVQTWDDEPEPAEETVEETGVDDDFIARYTDVSLDDPPSVTSVPSPVACGDPAPEVSTSQANFKQRLIAPESRVVPSGWSPGSLPTAGTVLEYGGEGDMPAFVSDPMRVFVQDGQVVSTDGGYGSFSVFREGATRSHDVRLESTMRDCRVENELSFLPAGEYDVYMVQRIVNTPERAAMWELRGTGYTLANVGDGAFYEPGSYDCEQAQATSNPVPLECHPNGVPGATVDLDARTATLPYSSTWFREELDLTLVSEPVTVTIAEQATVLTGPENIDAHPISAMAQPQCGTVYDRAVGGLLTLGAASGPPAADDIPFTEPVVFRARTATDGRHSEVTFEGPAPVVFTVHENNLTRTGTAVRVVGHGEATFRVDGPVEIDRYDGPADVPITFSDVQWCDGSRPHEPLTQAYIRAGAVVRAGDGDSTEVPAVVADFDAVLVNNES